MIVTASLLIASFCVSGVSIGSYPELTHGKRATLIGVSGLVAAALWGFMYWRHEEPIPGPLLVAQIAEMTTLAQFLSEPEEIPDQNSEDRLKKLFDFPDMIRNNVLDIKRKMSPESMTQPQLTALDNYFLDSIIAADSRFLTFTTEGEDNHYVIHYQTISWIRQSKKYIENKKRLASFTTSISLPVDIRSWVTELDKTIEDNSNSFVPLMNEYLKMDPRYILEDEVGGSRYTQVATKAYWTQCKPLTPKANEIIRLIRQYLKVDK